MTPTNDDRADWAFAALTRYAELTRHNPNDRDWAEIVRDLMGDLMHFCAREKIDFAQELTWAEGNYEDERDESGDED